MCTFQPSQEIALGGPFLGLRARAKMPELVNAIVSYPVQLHGMHHPRSNANLHPSLAFWPRKWLPAWPQFGLFQGPLGPQKCKTQVQLSYCISTTIKKALLNNILPMCYLRLANLHPIVAFWHLACSKAHLDLKHARIRCSLASASQPPLKKHS